MTNISEAHLVTNLILFIIAGDQIFVKTVASPQDLQVLLNYTYRQAAIDSINRFHRTALHMACDANKVSSHERIVLRLVDDYGCNVNLKDMHGRSAIDLLVQDKVMRDAPSSTEARERVLMGRRLDDLNRMFDEFEAIDRKRTEERRQEILDECIQRGKHPILSLALVDGVNVIHLSPSRMGTRRSVMGCCSRC